MKQGWTKLTHRKNLKSCSENAYAGYNATEAVNGYYTKIKDVDFSSPIYNGKKDITLTWWTKTTQSADQDPRGR